MPIRVSAISPGSPKWPRWPLRQPKLAGLRKWVVSGFENVLIFYLPCPGGVSIVRVACRAGLVATSWNPMISEPIPPADDKPYGRREEEISLDEAG
jgi:hypothetical protein